MGTRTGHTAVLDQLIADGFRYMFGNPGTSEEGFLDALSDRPELTYVLALQESVAVMVADGYARATGGPALVQIHSTPGLGNAVGALYQAMRGHSPLVVIGGDAGVRYQPLDAQMAGDLVGMARPVTKWATMVTDPASLLRVLRRAVKIALTPPRGPVYVCLPIDVLDAPSAEAVTPTVVPSTRVAPDDDLIRQTAEVFAAAVRPVIFVGDGVSASGAQPELTRVAELLGAEVWGVDAGDLNMSYAHPLWQDLTGHMFGSVSKPITTAGDALLVCGTYLMPEVFPELGPIFAPGARVVHIDLNAYEIAKNHPVDIGLVSDPKLTLARLAAALDATMTAEQKQKAQGRAVAIGAKKAERVAAERAADQPVRDHVPLRFTRFAEDLAGILPADAVIFDEALTNSPAVVRYLTPTEPGRYFLSRGGSLGVGITGGVGAQLANPGKTVVAFSGDGGAMYTIQALWTAARANAPVKLVICNNRSYRLLQVNLQAFWRERGIVPHNFPLSFDMSEPPLRFDHIAQGYGVAAARVERPDEIVPTIRRALAHPGPFLIDVALEGDVHPELIGVRCGQ
ncbi:thiamine pyrophosphate-binding protein [bacterium]|nr:thiamine pyrophosphate-binding protein [bacterium]